MKLKNEIMLITYADSLGKNLKDLHTVLDKYYKEAVGGVHILPFFPSSLLLLLPLDCPLTAPRLPLDCHLTDTDCSFLL